MNREEKKRIEFESALKETLKLAKIGKETTTLFTSKEKANRLHELKGLSRKEQFFKWCRIYFPAYTKYEFNKLHHYIIDALERDITELNRCEVYPIAGFRESAKTTIWQLYLVFNFCLPKYHFPIIISDTLKLASVLRKDIIDMISANDLLLFDFDFEIEENTEERFICNDICLMIASHISGIRGFKFKHYRPDLPIVDDYENKKTVRNPDICELKFSVLKGEILGAISKEFSTMLYVGNRIKKNSALDLSIKFWSKNSKVFPAVYVEKGIKKSNWEERYTIEDWVIIEKNVGEEAWLTEYQQEYFLKTQLFRYETIQYFDPLNEHIRNKFKRTLFWLDPAHSQKNNICMKCLVLGSIDDIDPKFANYYIHDIWLDFGHYSHIFKHAYKLKCNFNPRPEIVLYENNGNQWKHIKPAYDKFKYAHRLKMLPKLNDKDIPKEARIESFVQHFEDGRVWFSEHLRDNPHFDRYITQHTSYPFGLKDGIDGVTSFMIHVHKYRKRSFIYSSSKPIKSTDKSIGVSVNRRKFKKHRFAS